MQDTRQEVKALFSRNLANFKFELQHAAYSQLQNKTIVSCGKIYQTLILLYYFQGYLHD